LTKIPLIYSISLWGAWGLVWGAKPTKVPRGDGIGWCLWHTVTIVHRDQDNATELETEKYFYSVFTGIIRSNSICIDCTFESCFA